MTKSQLIAMLVARSRHLTHGDVHAATQHLLDQVSDTLAAGRRVEVRGFGCFRLHYRQPRMGHNPGSGASIAIPGRHIPHFKAGKSLRERVNAVTSDDEN
jgi:integration host factor subunit beta